MLEAVSSSDYPSISYSLPFTGMAKPRMTQRDKFSPSEAVQRYWIYKDDVQMWLTANKVKFLPVPYHLIFLMPMPNSWSNKKREQHNLMPHLPRPDKDNLEKGFLDAVLEEDSLAWDGRISKLWYPYGFVIVQSLAPMDWCATLKKSGLETFTRTP